MDESRTIELNITSNARSLPIVRGAVDKMAKMEGFGETDAHALMLAIDEALANVIKHGYDGDPNQPIAITLESVRSSDGRAGIAVRVRDRGRQVDPSTIRSRDLSDIRPGGLGVHIIQSVMDEYDYSCPPDGGMLLRMVKYVGPGTLAAAGPPKNA
jgi:anti-sigma regulatory factor (Ser/Thr protein kinase)